MTRTTTLHQLRNRYLLVRVIESLLFAAGAGCFAWRMIEFLHLSTVITAVVAALVGIGIFVGRIRFLKLASINDLRVSYYLNRSLPELQDSLDLLAVKGTLTPLQELQAQKVREIFSKTRAIKLPNKIGVAVLACMLGIATLVLFNAHGNGDESIGDHDPAQTAIVNIPPASLDAHSIRIEPPRYTRLPVSTTDQLSIKVPEQSVLTWRLGFKGNPESPMLKFSNGDSIGFTTDGSSYVAKYPVRESLLYQLAWTDRDKKYASDYFRIEMNSDRPPSVNITDLAQFVRLSWGDKKSITFHSVMQDDYGIRQAHVIATVSKGSGESVKFREDKLLFNAPAFVAGQRVEAGRTLDFAQLGMEPGDEVYFYVETFDNRRPEPNRNRTETYFVSLQDTASHEMSLDAGFGVDQMPEYFRSQRQIIIDTEKLLKNKSGISKHTFNSTSNELGYDQKVLRLRYGQFLGEEFETAIGEPIREEEHTEQEGEGVEEDVMKKFGHEHDTENEHNLVEDKSAKKADPQHEHNGEEDNKDPMEAFKHNHDNMDEATFFTQSIRAKLKAALYLMWDSELQLRLYEPKKSLPYQYQILKLLKEISQDSRVYVHRMGFDPPPLKEEKRLTGDQAEIRNSFTPRPPALGSPNSKIADAAGSIAEILEKQNLILTADFKEALREAGDELATLAVKSPGNYLPTLSDIRKILEGTLDPATTRETLEKIVRTFWKILPQEHRSPTARPITVHPLEEEFLKELNRIPK